MYGSSRGGMRLGIASGGHGEGGRLEVAECGKEPRSDEAKSHFAFHTNADANANARSQMSTIMGRQSSRIANRVWRRLRVIGR
jgi:hypothetical protein